jgi:hypothetical protein
MKTLFAMAAAGTLMLSGAGASTAELPSYELMGFPITPLQLQVLGSANVKEQSPNSSLTTAGTPASPPSDGCLDAARETNRGGSRRQQIQSQRQASRVAKKKLTCLRP